MIVKGTNIILMLLWMFFTNNIKKPTCDSLFVFLAFLNSNFVQHNSIKVNVVSADSQDKSLNFTILGFRRPSGATLA